MINQRITQDNRILLLGIFLLGAALRLYFLYAHLTSINSDEAIIGLMARHILQREVPVLYYGQTYYGPLDAYLTAPLFSLFGSSGAVLHIVPFVASLLFPFTLYALGCQLYSRQVGLISAVLAAISPVFLTLRGLRADAAYILVLLIGTTSLIVFHQQLVQPSRKKLMALIALWALGLYTFPLMAYYILASVIVVLPVLDLQFQSFTKTTISNKNTVLILSSTIPLLVLTLWLVGKLRGLPVLSDLFSTFLEIYKIVFPILMGFLPPSENYDLFQQVFSTYHPLLQWCILLITGLVFTLCIGYSYKHFKENTLLSIFVSSTLIVYILFFTIVGVTKYTLTFPRYLFPLYTAIPLFVNAILHMVRNRYIQWTLLIAILGINIIGNITLPSSTSQKAEFVAWFSRFQSTQYIYTDYWIGYWLAFETKEKVIPYIISDKNSPGMNRYKPYMNEVLNADDPMYVYYSGSPGEKDFVQFVEQNEIKYHKDVIEPYSIYWNLSQPIQIRAKGLTLYSVP